MNLPTQLLFFFVVFAKNNSMLARNKFKYNVGSKILSRSNLKQRNVTIKLQYQGTLN